MSKSDYKMYSTNFIIKVTHWEVGERSLASESESPAVKTLLSIYSTSLKLQSHPPYNMNNKNYSAVSLQNNICEILGPELHTKKALNEESNIIIFLIFLLTM